MATSDTQRHAPAFDPKSEVARAIEIASDLCLIEDPPEEPFRSKYKARDVLIKAKQSHAREAATGSGASNPSVALIDYRLGVIALAVEENSAAQEALDKCAVAFFDEVVGKIVAAAGKEEDEDGNDGRTKGGAGDKPSPPPVPMEVPPGMAVPCPLARQHPAEAADTLTQLGLLWAARGYPRRSLLYLLASVGFLQESCSSAAGDGADEEQGDKMEEDAGTEGRGGDGGVPGTKAEGADRREEKLESLLTHTLYYLAQAYGTQDAEQSAKYCAITLQRQLDAAERGKGREVSFDPGEWSRNACFLATYYGGQGLSRAAGRCLLAAESVVAKSKGRKFEKPDESKTAPMPPPPPLPSSGVPPAAESATNFDDANANAGGDGSQGGTSCGAEGGSGDGAGAGQEEQEEGEERRERRADVDRHLANLYVSVLEARHHESVAPLGGFDPIGEVPPRVAAASTRSGKGSEGEKERREREAEEKLGFVSLGLGDLPLCDPSEVGGDFESIREVFKLAKRYTDRALQHYVLDGYVTAHVALQQGISKAYRCLTTYEPDMKRRVAMFARRAQALEPLVKVLAVKAYLRLHKELSFELGEIYQEMARVKLERLNDTENPVKNAKSSLRAIVTMYKTALDFFAHFVKLYHQEDKTGGAPDSPAQPDKSMESEEVQGYLMARFMRARLNARLTPSDMKKKLAYTCLSLAEFSWIVEHADKLLSDVRKKDPEIFQNEMEMVKDYVRMQEGNKDRLTEAIQEEAAYF